MLEKIKTLELNPNYLSFEEDENKKSIDQLEVIDIVMKKKKSHLFQLLPLLSEFIISNNTEIKHMIKDIFKQITNEMGVK